MAEITNLIEYMAEQCLKFLNNEPVKPEKLVHCIETFEDGHYGDELREAYFGSQSWESLLEFKKIFYEKKTARSQNERADQASLA